MERKISLDKGLIRTINWMKINLKDFSIKDENYEHKK